MTLGELHGAVKSYIKVLKKAGTPVIVYTCKDDDDDVRNFNTLKMLLNS